MSGFRTPAVQFGIGTMLLGIVLMFFVPSPYSTLVTMMIAGGFGFVAGRLAND